MATNAVSMVVDDGHLLTVLQQARKQLESAGSEVVLDFSAVRRVNSGALTELQTLAETARGKLVLRGVNVEVYKVLKLVKLTGRFRFE